MGGLLLFWRGPDDQVRPIDLAPDASIADLKAAIAASGGPPATCQRLCLGGAPLCDDGAELADCGVSQECCFQVEVGAAPRVPLVAAGDEHSLAIRDDGKVEAWGCNSSKQLPTPDSRNRAARAVFAYGDTSCVLFEDGSVSSYGRTAPQVPKAFRTGRQPVVHLAPHKDHVLAALEDGGVSAWGHSAVCSALPEVSDKVLRVATTHSHALLLMADGTVLPVGRGLRVLKWTGARAVDVAVSDVPNFAVLLDDGRVIAWDRTMREGRQLPSAARSICSCRFGIQAELSDGAVVDVMTGSSWARGQRSQRTLSGMACGLGHVVALTPEGDVVAWGSNSRKQSRVPLLEAGRRFFHY